MKVHIHSEQFDGHAHAWCGRGKAPLVADAMAFEATNPSERCKVCERDWFPNGQPHWHLEAAKKRLASRVENA